MKIMLVDDSDMFRKVTIENLKVCGYDDIVQACNGIEAMVQIDGVDLVIADICMPHMNGLALAQEMRRDLKYTRIPIIFITDVCQENTVLEAFKVGGDALILKPFKIEDLVDKIKEVMSRKRSPFTIKSK